MLYSGKGADQVAQGYILSKDTLSEAEVLLDNMRILKNICLPSISISPKEPLQPKEMTWRKTASIVMLSICCQNIFCGDIGKASVMVKRLEKNSIQNSTRHHEETFAR